MLAALFPLVLIFARTANSSGPSHSTLVNPDGLGPGSIGGLNLSCLMFIRMGNLDLLPRIPILALALVVV